MRRGTPCAPARLHPFSQFHRDEFSYEDCGVSTGFNRQNFEFMQGVWQRGILGDWSVCSPSLEY